MPRVTIAQSDLGQCAGCGASVDRGEAIVQTGVGIVHAGCEARAVNAVDAPVLFALSGTPAIEHRATSSESRSHAPTDYSGNETRQYIGQRERVFSVMQDSRWRTLQEIARLTGCLETSVSIRLREIRRAGHTVIHEPLGDGSTIRRYRLIANQEGVNEQHAA